MKKLTAFILSAMMVLSLAACGAKTDAPAADSTTSTEITDLTYAVEAGSAGEEVAGENGFKTVSVDSQAKALMEVKSGTADLAVIDSVAAIGMINTDSNYSDLVINMDNNFGDQEYGIAFRQGSDFTAMVNEALQELQADGTFEELAAKYDLTEALLDR